MRWESGRRSDNIEDRRRAAPALALGGGLGIVIMVVMVLLSGGNLGDVLKVVVNNAAQQAPVQQPGEISAEEDRLADFTSVVLADTEDVWDDLFAKMGKQYQHPELVLFTGQVQSACGFANSAVGPFYCPGDRKVYIDLSFYADMKNKFNAAGDFAQAYVVAHEVGHHVQNLLGISSEVNEARGRVSEEKYNQLSVRLELQADFLAGVWAHHAQKARNILEEGDIEEALRCAQAIGDDRLQMKSRGYVQPESFTHGTAAQRAKWLRLGLQTGDIQRGDTFNVPESQL